MKTRSILELVGNGSMYILTVTQTREIFEIVSLILSILISLLILISHVIAWFKKANYDGKITGEEFKELVNTTKEDLDKLKEEADEIVEVVEAHNKED